jgi:hypothetical protein
VKVSDLESDIYVGHVYKLQMQDEGTDEGARTNKRSGWKKNISFSPRVACLLSSVSDRCLFLKS